MAGDGGKSSKKDKKRKNPQNLRYKAENRCEKGHIRRLKKHVRKQGLAPDVETALLRWGQLAGVREMGSVTEFIKQAKAGKLVQ